MRHLVFVTFVTFVLSVFPPNMIASAIAEQRTIYVSQLGDDSDGTSWERAFRTIQKAIQAIPSPDGAYRVLIRPDTYMEANLFPAHPGAKGSYNILEADYDGTGGSGRTGYAVIDSSDPERGLKSVDWWSPFRADTTFSSVGWDRWIFRHIYATGAEAGMGWDMTADEGAQFSVLVEDCFGIGRAFGAIVAAFTARVEEPIIYRRCQLWSLDWWGDAAGAYVRANNTAMPDHPDVIFEDCTLVGPDNALQAGNPGYKGYTRVSLKDCRLISLNFSQPRGTPSTGIIYSTIRGKLLHVDLEDCTLMGYKVFGAGEGEISYSTKGSVRAYVQFEQPVPEGMHRLGHWPLDTFQSILPPMPSDNRPAFMDKQIVRDNMCEVSPFLWEGKIYLLECVRPATGGDPKEYYLVIQDAETSQQVARFGEGYGLACALVHENALYVFASLYEPNNGWNDVTLFYSHDLKKWQKTVVIKQDEKEHLFNSSVCWTGDRFVMAYESDDPAYPAFTVKFASSKDGVAWTKIPDAIFGKDRYTACPCIRFADATYYLLYLERRTPRWFFETWLARSEDLVNWELSRLNPVLTPQGNSEGINASDPDVVEFQGRTHIYYSVGDQLTWMNTMKCVYPGSLRELFRAYFPDH